MSISINRRTYNKRKKYISMWFNTRNPNPNLMENLPTDFSSNEFGPVWAFKKNILSL